MKYQDLFEKFYMEGQLYLPDTAISFAEIPWNRHPSFDGVDLKHLVTAGKTGGQFSYHLVRIAPGKAIGNHIHETQLETHEIISGTGICVNNGVELIYEPGVISILPRGLPHEVKAGPDGLCLFAKFIPALTRSQNNGARISHACR